MALDKLSPAELIEMESLAAESSAASMIRSAGNPCKHVYRTWSDVDSDIYLGGMRVAAAIYEDHDGKPWTAAFTPSGGVEVTEGW